MAGRKSARNGRRSAAAGKSGKSKTKKISSSGKTVKKTSFSPTKKRRSSRLKKPISEMTDRDWKKWGKGLGDRIERSFSQFGEEMEWHGKRIEKHGKLLEEKAMSWWYRTFGSLAPLIESIFSVVCIWIAVLVINFLNVLLPGVLLTEISSFLSSHIGFFFSISLFFNSIKYIIRIYKRTYWVLKPIDFAAKVTVFLWGLAWAFLIINHSTGIALFSTMSGMIFPRLYLVLILLAVLSYVAVIILHSLIDRRALK